MPLPSDDRGYISKKSMEQDIISLFGGRAAEQIIIHDITTGASNDIQRASELARKMVMRYGMSDKLGPIMFSDDSGEVFLGRDIGHGRNYSEEVASEIDSEINNIITTAYNEALRILNEHLDILHKTAEVLMEREKITGDEFRKIISGDPLDDVIIEEEPKENKEQ